jgi:hypothetical protein
VLCLDVEHNVTEQQAYRVIERHGSVELRRYERCTVADVVVSGSLEAAGNTAFRPLVSYISGANRTASTTATPDATSERLAMTAPVLQQESTDGNAGEWVVSFVLPGDRPANEYPEPTDPRVRLREVPAFTAAAIRWSGRWSGANVTARTAELRAELERHGWAAVGAPLWARFDPPWKPAFLRRNEVVIPVSAVPTEIGNKLTQP